MLIKEIDVSGESKHCEVFVWSERTYPLACFLPIPIQFVSLHCREQHGCPALHKMHSACLRLGAKVGPSTCENAASLGFDPVAAEAGSPILSFCQIHSQKDNQVGPATLTSHNAGLLHLTVHTDSTKSKLGTLNNMHESNAYTLVSNRWLRGKSSLGGSCAATSSHFPSQPQATTKTMQKESSRLNGPCKDVTNLMSSPESKPAIFCRLADLASRPLI